MTARPPWQSLPAGRRRYNSWPWDPGDRYCCRPRTPGSGKARERILEVPGKGPLQPLDGKKACWRGRKAGWTVPCSLRRWSGRRARLL